VRLAESRWGYPLDRANGRVPAPSEYMSTSVSTPTLEKRLAAIKLAKQRRAAASSGGSSGNPGTKKRPSRAAIGRSPSALPTLPPPSSPLALSSSSVAAEGRGQPLSPSRPPSAGRSASPSHNRLGRPLSSSRGGPQQRSSSSRSAARSAATGDAALKRLLVKNEALQAELEALQDEKDGLDELLATVSQEMNDMIEVREEDERLEAEMARLEEELQEEVAARHAAEATAAEYKGLLQQATDELEAVNEATAEHEALRQQLQHEVCRGRGGGSDQQLVTWV
jgi:hypothetical protein